MSTIRIKNLSMIEVFNFIDNYKINIESIDANNMLVTISLKADFVTVKAMSKVTIIELVTADKQTGRDTNVMQVTVWTNSYEKIEVF